MKLLLAPRTNCWNGRPARISWSWLVIAAALLVPLPLAAQPGDFSPFMRRGLRTSRPTVPPPLAPRMEEQFEGAVRVALLNLDRTSLGALVEARLRDKKIVNWWPRAATGELLAEVQLSTALDPPAIREPNLSQPELPDAIVLLRTGRQGETQWGEVVVCEPGLGLRLGVQRLDLAGEPAKDVDALANAAIGGLKKLGEKLQQLWAVPPFRPQDPPTAADELPLTLARQAEQALLTQRGVFAVELEYAYVVAAARRMARVTEGVSRPVPRFLIGQYKHEGAEPERKLAISIAMQENEMPGQSQTLAAAALPEAIAALHRQATELATGLKDATLTRDNGSGEKNLLAAVSREYQQANQWRGALALAESRLLLDPADRQWRSWAISHAGKLVNEQWGAAARLGALPGPAAAPSAVLSAAPAAPPAPRAAPGELPPAAPLPAPGAAPVVPGAVPAPLPPSAAPTPAGPATAAATHSPEYVRAVLEALNTYRRCARHFERQLATPPVDGRGVSAWLPSPGAEFGYLPLNTSPVLDRSPELSVLVRALRRMRQELLLDYVELAAINGEPGDMYVFSDLPPEERQALVVRMIVDFRLYPRPEIRNQAYINAALNYAGGAEQSEAFLAQLETLAEPTVQKAVQQARAQRARRAVAPGRTAPATVPAPRAPDP